MASTTVVIRGPAIIAGSNPIFFASIGRVQPIPFATTTITAIVNDTVKFTERVTLSKIRSLTKFTAPS